MPTSTARGSRWLTALAVVALAMAGCKKSTTRNPDSPDYSTVHTTEDPTNNADQEVLGDGIDNDGDGLVDCEDDEFALWEGTPDAATLPEVCRGGDLPVCLDGDLTVSSADLMNAETLGCIAQVSGRLLIGYDEIPVPFNVPIPCEAHSDIPAIDGLSALQVVEGRVAIRCLPQLTELGGLPALTWAKALRIEEVDSLTLVSGLPELAVLEGDLVLPKRGNIAEITGLNALRIIEGDLGSDSNPLTDISGLGALESVGNLTFEWSQLADLSDLQSLTVVGGEFVILSNAQMVSLNLPSLGSIGSMTLANERLLRLDLDAHPTVTGTLILGNADLQSLDGLQGVVSLDAIEMTHNDALTSLSGLDNLETADTIELTWNESLINLNGLEALNEVTTELLIVQNNRLVDVDALQNLHTVEWIEFTSNSALRSVAGLSGLVDVDLVYMNSNSVLETLPVWSLSSLSQSLFLSNNDSLTSLDGLQSLQTIGYELSLRGNAQLADVTALHGLISTPRVEITDNPVLTDAAAWALVDAIDQEPDSVGIVGNN